MLELTYRSCETGNCRVYYTAPGKNPKHKLLYCMQQEWSKQQADKYNRELFKLYRCSKDGEPEYTIELGQILTIDYPKGNEEIETLLIKFLKTKELKL